MTRINQIKSHLIEIIGDRSQVRAKNYGKVARSSCVITDAMQSLGYQMFSQGDGWVYMLSHKQKPLVAARGGVHFRINLKEVK